jgi:hypothetical protein
MIVDTNGEEGHMSSVSGASADLMKQLEELLETQKISRLLIEFGYLLDTKNWRAQAELYADDGVLELAFAGVTVTKEQLVKGEGKGLRDYRLTQHFSTNHRIELDGDTAHSRSYMLAIHMYEDPFKHADVGGFYDCDYVKVDNVWKFKKVVVNVNWTAGDSMLPHPE